ncbi:MAG: 4-(cytidine 5'-diphospho)-2-C-methyl-D-erythritol kinase [Clostridia bacterium]|nr:4-(cytidine 5'-diphospho)-2-C-methyl-D-erythritol kinase [Clostridia bacterium]
MRIERANAKINLYLDVTSRRENGYHEIYSVMQSVSLCDLVTVDFRPAEHTTIRLCASGNDKMPTDCRNLAWRAAELFLQSTERRGEVTVSIEKHIPMAAGLAGGSTDAAAVLRALNRICGSPMTTEQLCTLGARLGADVPFCIVGGCAIAEGIGEILTPHKGLDAQNLVVDCMGEGVSTPWAYGELDRIFEDCSTPRSKDAGKALADGLANGADTETLCASFYNIFESVVPNVQPYVDRLKAVMTEKGAVGAMMSGSGPSVFGVFDTPEAASDACLALRELGAAAFVCHAAPAYPVL